MYKLDSLQKWALTGNRDSGSEKAITQTIKPANSRQKKKIQRQGNMWHLVRRLACSPIVPFLLLACIAVFVDLALITEHNRTAGILTLRITPQGSSSGAGATHPRAAPVHFARSVAAALPAHVSLGTTKVCSAAREDAAHKTCHGWPLRLAVATELSPAMAPLAAPHAGGWNPRVAAHLRAGLCAAAVQTFAINARLGQGVLRLLEKMLHLPRHGGRQRLVGRVLAAVLGALCGLPFARAVLAMHGLRTAAAQLPPWTSVQHGAAYGLGLCAALCSAVISVIGVVFL